jgi:tol-pal system protein YbgF
VGFDRFALVLSAFGLSYACAVPAQYDPATGVYYGTGAPSATLLEMLGRVEQLQNDVSKMRGEIEELSHEVETLKKQQRDQYLELDQRIRQLVGSKRDQAEVPGQPQPGEGAPATPPEAPQPPPAEPSAAPPASPGDPAARQGSYQQAFSTLKDGRYNEAIAQFSSFLSAYPTGEYSDNARYWLAETYYVTRDFPAARENFNRILSDFPQSPKVADATLKLGFIEYETGQWLKARQILTDVIKRYPGSTTAKLAEKRLEKMRQEGH